MSPRLLMPLALRLAFFLVLALAMAYNRPFLKRHPQQKDKASSAVISFELVAVSSDRVLDRETTTLSASRATTLTASKAHMFLEAALAKHDRGGEEGQVQQQHTLTSKAWKDLLDMSIRWRFEKLGISIFEAMTSRHVMCYPHTMTEFLQMLCSANMYDEALAVFDKFVAAGSDPTVHNFSPLLKSCGSASKARDLLQRMEHSGLSPNVISYTAAIKSCEPFGDITSALAIMDLMRACSVVPNEVTYCCVISVASRSMQGGIAVNLLREMASYGLAPNQLCYGSALTACARCGMWKEVDMLFDEMDRQGLTLQESVLISVINVCRISSLVEQQQGGSSSSNDNNNSNFSTNATTNSQYYQRLSHVFGNGQWSRAVSLVKNWAQKVDNVTESVFTMAMDVCEASGRDEEVINLFRHMLQQGVKPSKSSYTFALRACARSANITEAVQILYDAEALGLAVPFMYNTTLIFLDSVGKHEVAIGVLRRILDAQNQEQQEFNGEEAGATSGRRFIRNSPLLTKRVLSHALDSLTRNFSAIFTDVISGRLAPTASKRKFVADITEVLRATVMETVGGGSFMSPACYPIANKLMLDCGDYETLRVLLNSTLYTRDVNSSRLYEFALRSLIPFPISTNEELSVNTSLIGENMRNGVVQVLNLLEDVHTAGNEYTPLAQSMMLQAMTRLQLAHAEKNTGKLAGVGSGGGINRLPAFASSLVIERSILIYELFIDGRGLLGKENMPERAYAVAGIACRDAQMPSLMLEVYKTALEDDKADKFLKNLAAFALSKTEHWEIAVEIIDDMMEKNEVPDVFMFSSCLRACETGKDWEHALFLLDQMRKLGHSLNTVVCTSTIAACAAAAKMDEALALFDMMEEKGIRRNVYTYNAAISACTKSGAWKEALKIYEKMQLEGGSTSATSIENSVPLPKIMDEQEEEEEEEAEEDEKDEGEGEEEEEEEEEEESGEDWEAGEDFFASRSAKTSVEMYGSLMECLGEGGQELLVDVLYKQAVLNKVVKPYENLYRPNRQIDLHGHSSHMAKAAVRLAFEEFSQTNCSTLRNGKWQNRDVAVIVGKGNTLMKVIASQCKDELRPAIRSYVSSKNTGRLFLLARDVANWVQLHTSQN